MADWTKRQIIQQAFSEIGKASVDFDLSPESLQDGLEKLDAMVATWSTKGIRIGWAGGDGKGDVDAGATAPMWAVEALYLNLAIRLAPGFGKTVSPNTMASARMAYDGLLARTVTPAARAIQGYGGAGRQDVPLPVDRDPLQAGEDGALDIEV